MQGFRGKKSSRKLCTFKVSQQAKFLKIHSLKVEWKRCGSGAKWFESLKVFTAI